MEIKMKSGEIFKEQITRMVQLDKYDSIQKRIAIILKTVELFKFNSNEIKEKCIFFLLHQNNLSNISSSVISEVKEQVKKKSSTLLKVENFSFVFSEVTKEDLQYQSGSFLTLQEVQYYLYRLSLKLSAAGGYSTLARNYFLSLKDNYKKFTGKSITKQKIAQLNKILQKYKYIFICDNNRKFYLGSNHPLFNSNIVFESNRLFVSGAKEVVTTVKEQVKNIQQDYKNLVTDYQKQEEKLNLYKTFIYDPCMN